MLTVVIPTRDSAPDLVLLLPALVPAAVDGLVRQVMVVDGGSTDATLAICKDAGIDVVASFDEAAGQAKGELILLLPPAHRLRDGWAEAVGAHLVRGGGQARITGAKAGWLKTAPAGVLVAREALKGCADLASAMRRARGARRI